MRVDPDGQKPSIPRDGSTLTCKGESGENMKTTRNAARPLVLAGLITAALLAGFYWQGLQTGGSTPQPTSLIEQTFEMKGREVKPFIVRLDAGETVHGTFSEATGLCLGFYVLSETDYPLLIDGAENFSSYVAVEKVRSYNFTFTAPVTGNYYFVFDNGYVHKEALCDKLPMFRLTRVETPAFVYTERRIGRTIA